LIKTMLPDAKKATLCDLVERDQGRLSSATAS